MLKHKQEDLIVAKQDLKQKIKNLELRLGELQRKARDYKIPVLIIFEGWNASGRGTLLNRLILSLDPRGYKVYFLREGKKNKKEINDSPLKYFWTKIPAQGEIVFWDRSWYYKKLSLKKRISYQDILNSERQLVDNGYLIIKFFLHTNRKELKKRIKKMYKNAIAPWRIPQQDWEQYKRYKKIRKQYKKILNRTNFPFSQWHILDTTNKRLAILQLYEIVVQSIESHIEKIQKQENVSSNINVESGQEHQNSILDTIDLNQSLTEEEYRSQLEQCQNELRKLQHILYRKKIPVSILFEGWDASGKGGTIRRLVKKLDPRGYDVIPISAPNEREKKYHYLWRFWTVLPEPGMIGIFDRTWYGRVLVERIERFCSVDDWKRAYQEINEFEYWLYKSGMIVIKFWLHIDPETQLRRFRERENNPYKTWKITEEDWRNREKWDLYKIAIEDMIQKTSTEYAPWNIIAFNYKWYGRIYTYRTIIDTIKNRIDNL